MYNFIRIRCKKGKVFFIFKIRYTYPININRGYSAFEKSMPVEYD